MTETVVGNAGNIRLKLALMSIPSRLKIFSRSVDHSEVGSSAANLGV